ncbi:MAG: hypothetical protein IT473_11830, partial [Lysobacter sp.]|nr:hypothetical protein [Lysobacter sp.]
MLPRKSTADASFLAAARKIFALGAPFARTIAFCMALILISTAIHLSLPIGVQRLFDKMLVAQNVEVIHAAAMVLLLVFVVRAVLSYFGSYMLQVVGDRIVVLLRKQFFKHLQSLDLAFHHSQRVGDLMSRLSNDVGAISNIVAGTAVSLVVSSLQLIGAAAVMIGINWRLALVV